MSNFTACLNNWIQTYTGKKFYPYNPQPDQIDIEDIANALSMLCRFTGHCKWHYSVAQHSVLVAQAMQKDGYSNTWVLRGLMHDASEAYMGDLNTPTKACLPDYRALEKKIEHVIYKAFGIDGFTEDQYKAFVKPYDNLLFANEARQLMPNVQEYDLPYVDQIISIQMLTPARAKEQFLEMYYNLTKQMTETKRFADYLAFYN